MIDEKKYNQYGFPRNLTDVKGICLHETGNYNMNAQQLFDYLNNESKDSRGCHYICDDTKTIQVMPNDYAIYHTGKGKDWGCRYTIAIEIVSSVSDEKYRLAQDRAIQLIKDLMEEFNLTINDIYLHNDFDEKVYCPNTILRNYGSAKRFAIEELL